MIPEQENQVNSQLFNTTIRFISTYNEGDVVFQEGSRGREMYVIYSGQVRISKKDPTGHDTVLSVLGPGEIFGEMALIDQGQRSATITAIEDSTKLVVLDRTWFIYLLRHEPEFALIVMKTLCQRIREKNVQYAQLLEDTQSTITEE